jgi:hypothetical protein
MGFIMHLVLERISLNIMPCSSYVTAHAVLVSLAVGVVAVDVQGYAGMCGRWATCVSMLCMLAARDKGRIITRCMVAQAVDEPRDTGLYD